MYKLTGLVAAPFTPMDNDGQVQLSTIDTLAHLLKKNKVAGAFICGTTGEGPLLTLAEKKRVVEKWSQHRTSDFRILVMLGGNSIPEMQELGQFSRQLGMDGVALLAPYYFKPKSLDDLILFCQKVTGEIPDLPLYYYHLPAFTGAYFPMINFLQKAKEVLPNLVGIKFTHTDLMDFHACVRFDDRKYNLLWGTDEALLSGLVIGANGAVGSTYNYAAPLYHQIIDAFRGGNLQLAESLQYKAVQMVQVLLSAGGVGAGKAFMKLIGADCGPARLPNRLPDNERIQDMRKQLERIGFFSFCSRSN